MLIATDRSIGRDIDELAPFALLFPVFKGARYGAALLMKACVLFLMICVHATTYWILFAVIEKLSVCKYFCGVFQGQ